MAELNLVVAQAIKPAITASDLSLHSLERVADSAGLPPSIVHNPAGIVPLHAVELFLSLLQQKVGEQSFLFKSLELDPEENRKTHSVVGIPLPFFSYGGSGLWAFTLLLFIFVKLDSNRLYDW